MTTKVSKDLIASGSIGADHIVDGAVDESKLANSAVTTDKLKDKSVTGAKLAAKAISLSQVQAGGGKKGDLVTVNASGGLKLVSPSVQREELQTADLEGATSINIKPDDGMGKYTRHELLLRNVSFADMGCRLFIRFSNNKGVSWFSGEKDYRYFTTMGSAVTQGSSSAIELTWEDRKYLISNEAHDMLFGFFDLLNLTTENDPTVFYRISYIRNNLRANHTFTDGGGQLMKAESISGVQVYGTKFLPTDPKVKFKTGSVAFHGIS